MLRQGNSTGRLGSHRSEHVDDSLLTAPKPSESSIRVGRMAYLHSSLPVTIGVVYVEVPFHAFAHDAPTAFREVLETQGKSFMNDRRFSRFSLREIVMLTTIVALLIPYLVSGAAQQNRIGLDFNTIRDLILEVEPQTRILSGTGGGDASEFVIQVPKENSIQFFSNFHVALKRHIGKAGWTEGGSGKSSVNQQLVGFRMGCQKESSRCMVMARVLERKPATDILNEAEVDRLRIAVLYPHVDASSR